VRSSLHGLPIKFQGAGIVTREEAWGDMDVSHEVLPKGVDLAPLFKGLPGDRCQCPHWGYLLKGRVRIDYGDHQEVIEQGEAFFIEPGHLTIFEVDSEWIAFSPRGEHAKTAEVVRRNLQAAQGG
jgi:hypothetical protein